MLLSTVCAGSCRTLLHTVCAGDSRTLHAWFGTHPLCLALTAPLPFIRVQLSLLSYAHAPYQSLRQLVTVYFVRMLLGNVATIGCCVCEALIASLSLDSLHLLLDSLGLHCGFRCCTLRRLMPVSALRPVKVWWGQNGHHTPTLWKRLCEL
jgi:hypothetical protein